MSSDPALGNLRCSTLVLDLDGTISDPSLGIVRCFNYAFKNFGFPEVPSELIVREIGPPLDATFHKLAPGISDGDATSLVSKYRERYAEIGYCENTLYEAVPPALEQLRRKGISLGVCTSKRGDFAVKILRLFELEEYFGFIDGGDIGISKQSQLAALQEQRKIDDRAIMVGDRSIDILAAHANGMRGIGVLWGFGDIQELTEASADKILSRPEELCEIENCD